MGKKIDSTIVKTNGAAPVKKPATRPKKVVAAASKPARSTTPKAAAIATKSSGIDLADIARRAYFIAERRQRQGLPGNEEQDWLDAERELKAEAKKPRKTARA